MEGTWMEARSSFAGGYLFFLVVMLALELYHALSFRITWRAFLAPATLFLLWAFDAPIYGIFFVLAAQVVAATWDYVRKKTVRNRAGMFGTWMGTGFAICYFVILGSMLTREDDRVKLETDRVTLTNYDGPTQFSKDELTATLLLHLDGSRSLWIFRSTKRPKVRVSFESDEVFHSPTGDEATFHELATRIVVWAGIQPQIKVWPRTEPEPAFRISSGPDWRKSDGE